MLNRINTLAAHAIATAARERADAEKAIDRALRVNQQPRATAEEVGQMFAHLCETTDRAADLVRRCQELCPKESSEILTLARVMSQD